MALIRHNTRQSDREGGEQYAHDTTRMDTKGCFVPGRSDRIMTSVTHPCPHCGGYGALVAIDRTLGRDDYPKGCIIPEWGTLRNYVAGPLPETWAMGDEPVITGSWSEATGEPVPTEATGQDDAWDYDKGDYREEEETIVSLPTPVVDKGRAANALGELLSSLVDVDQIRDDIQNAVGQVRNDMRADTQQTIAAGIAILEENFKQAVESIVAPKVYVIERPESDQTVTVDGVHEAFEEVLDWITARDHEGFAGNVFLTGPAGSGKTTLARDVAKAIGMPFYTTGQVMGEHQVMGYGDAGGTYHSTSFRDPFEHGGLWLGDEFDAWSPEAALALNAGLANGHATFPDSTQPIARHVDSYFIVAGNTWGLGQDREYVGRNQMDAASLSRFVTISVDYDKTLESRLAGQYQEWLHTVWTARDRARDLGLRMTFGTRELVHGVRMLNTGKRDIKYVIKTVLQRNMTDGEWAKVAA